MRGKVYAVKLRYILKYLGYNKKNMFELVDKATSDDPLNIYYQTLDNIDHYHIVRFLINRDTPIMYTLATNQGTAVDRFHYILEHLLLVQSSNGIKSRYDSALLLNMLEHNVRPTELITWATDYKKEDYSYLGDIDIQELEGIPVELEEDDNTNENQGKAD